MAVSLNGNQVNSGLSRPPAPAKGLVASLLGLSRPRCPDCGKRGMVCRYVVPASYNEPAPFYFDCEHCAARYFRMTTGPWISAAGPQFAACYETALPRAA